MSGGGEVVERASLFFLLSSSPPRMLLQANKQTNKQTSPRGGDEVNGFLFSSSFIFFLVSSNTQGQSCGRGDLDCLGFEERRIKSC